MSPLLEGRFLNHWTTREVHKIFFSFFLFNSFLALFFLLKVRSPFSILLVITPEVITYSLLIKISFYLYALSQ